VSESLSTSSASHTAGWVQPRASSTATYPTLNRVVPTYNLLLDDLEGFLGLRDSEERSQPSATQVALLTSVFSEKPASQPATTFPSTTERLGPACTPSIAVILLDARYKMAYCKASGWEEDDHVAHTKNALLQVVEEDGAAVEARSGRHRDSLSRWGGRTKLQKCEATPCRHGERGGEIFPDRGC